MEALTEVNKLDGFQNVLWCHQECGAWKSQMLILTREDEILFIVGVSRFDLVNFQLCCVGRFTRFKIFRIEHLINIVKWYSEDEFGKVLSSLERLWKQYKCCIQGIKRRQRLLWCNPCLRWWSNPGTQSYPLSMLTLLPQYPAAKCSPTSSAVSKRSEVHWPTISSEFHVPRRGKCSTGRT